MHRLVLPSRAPAAAATAAAKQPSRYTVKLLIQSGYSIQAGRPPGTNVPGMISGVATGVRAAPDGTC